MIIKLFNVKNKKLRKKVHLKDWVGIKSAKKRLIYNGVEYESKIEYGIAV